MPAAFIVGNCSRTWHSVLAARRTSTMNSFLGKSSPVLRRSMRFRLALGAGGGRSLCVRSNCEGRARPGEPEPPDFGKQSKGPGGSNIPGSGRPEELPEEDRPPSFEEQSPYELTLSQQLLLQQYIAEIEQTSAETCREMCAAIMSQMMMKENLIKELLGRDDIQFPPMPQIPGSDDPPLDSGPRR